MENDLIKELLSNKPVINRINNTINSTIGFNGMNNIEDKEHYSPIVDLIIEYYPANVASNYHLRNIGAVDCLISRSLYVYFTNSDNVSHNVSEFFKGNVSDPGVIDKIFKYLSTFKALREDHEGYLLYNGNCKIKYGRVLRYLLELLYPLVNLESSSSRGAIETYVNTYKASFSKDEYNISVVNGSRILLGYKTKYHVRPGYSTTMLSNSCMNNKTSFMKLYTKNKKTVFMFIVTNLDGKIVSRNLVWYLPQYDNYYFDRVYAINDMISSKVYKFATDEGYMIYNRTLDNIKIKSNNSKNTKGKLKIKLKFWGIRKYPYLDTFKYQNKLSRYLKSNKTKGCRKYNYTNGSRSTF